MLQLPPDLTSNSTQGSSEVLDDEVKLPTAPHLHLLYHVRHVFCYLVVDNGVVFSPTELYGMRKHRQSREKSDHEWEGRRASTGLPKARS